MATIVVSPTNVASFPEGGGHMWVYLQYVHGLRRLGCDVYWLEHFRPSGDADKDAATLATFHDRMRRFEMRDRVILYTRAQPTGPCEFIGGVPRETAEAIFRRADLLLNFYYAIDPSLLACFRRTALVDIDPGLLQFWLGNGQITVPKHDLYFTTGETVGTPAARFPDCGLAWIPIRPIVCLDSWPYLHDPACEAFTTVSSWWGDEWIRNSTEVYENNKRVTFLEFADLPRRTPQPLELALYLGDGDAEDKATLLESGWRIRHSLDVARTPERYQSYIRTSRGEFSCAKPSCMKFQNAWISDRTLCYLASGKPAVVQDTGPSSYLPNGAGLFRFSTMEQAVDALATVNADYPKHCRAAREVSEACFDARTFLGKILSSI